MKIAEKGTLEEIEPRHWDRFAKDIGIGAACFHRRIRQLCQHDGVNEHRLPQMRNVVVTGPIPDTKTLGNHRLLYSMNDLLCCSVSVKMPDVEAAQF